MLTPEQLSLRRTGIGGSDAAAICGLNPYKSARDVWFEKIQTDEQDNLDRNDETEITPMVIGSIMEPSVIELYKRKTGFSVEIPTKTFRHPQYPFLIANIDGIVLGQDKILEAKTAGFRQKKRWEEEGTDRIPPEYLMQCVHYAFVLDKESVDIAVLIAGQDFRIYTYKRNRSLEKAYLEIAIKFWNSVQEKTFPDSVTLNEAIGDKADIAQNVTTDSQAIELCCEIKKRQEEIKSLESAVDDLKDHLIKGVMKGFKSVVDTEGRKLASIIHNQKDGIDSKRLKQELPDIYQQYLKPIVYASFRVF